jgi:hypothetical protein
VSALGLQVREARAKLEISASAIHGLYTLEISASAIHGLYIDQWSFRVLCKYIISNELQFLGALEYSMTLNSCGYLTVVTRGSSWWAVLGFVKNGHDL